MSLTISNKVSSAVETDEDTLLYNLGNKRQTAVAAKQVLNANADYPTVPPEFTKWLIDVKGVSKPTFKVYRHDVSQYLGHVEHETKRLARLEDAWNKDLFVKYNNKIVKTFKPTTQGNHHSAMAALRAFLQSSGRRPSNYLDLNDEFRRLMKTAMSKKKKYIKGQLKVKNKKKRLLGVLYRIIHNDG